MPDPRLFLPLVARVLRSAGNIQIYMKKYTIKYGNIPVTKQKVCCKITDTVQKTIIKKWNISDKIIVEVYRYMENELFEKAPVHKAYSSLKEREIRIW